MLEKIFEKSGRVDIIISAIFIILGIFLIVQTELFTSLISILLGGFTVIMGIIRLISYVKEGKDNGILLSASIFLIISGIVIMFFTNVILDVFRIIVAIWIIYVGIMNIIKLMSWKEYKSTLWIITLVLAIILLGIGIYILVNPNVIIKTIGAIIVAYGIIDIIANIILTSKIKEVKVK